MTFSQYTFFFTVNLNKTFAVITFKSLQTLFALKLLKKILMLFSSFYQNN